MHIAKDGCQHHLAFRIAFFFLQVMLKVGYCAFHDLCGLQHEWQDEFTRAEAVAYIFHRWQQDSIEHVDSSLTLRNTKFIGPFHNDLLDEWFNVLFAAM